jgi:hypothetical protein
MAGQTANETNFTTMMIMQMHPITSKLNTNNMYTKEQLMSHAATCMMNDELTEPDALTPLQSLSVADLIAVKELLFESACCEEDEAQIESMRNMLELTTEISRRYSALFPNNKHFTI